MVGMSSNNLSEGTTSASSGTALHAVPRTPGYWLVMWSIIIALTVLSMLAGDLALGLIGLGELNGAIWVVVFAVSWPSMYVRPSRLRDWIVVSAGLAVVGVFASTGFIIGAVLLGFGASKDLHWVLHLAGLLLAMFALWAPGLMIFHRVMRRHGLWSPGQAISAGVPTTL